YRMVSALAGVGFGERPFLGAAGRDLPVKLAARADRLRAQIAAIEEPVRRKLLAQMTKDKVAGPRSTAEWDFTAGLDDRVGKLYVKLHGGAKRDADGLHLDGKSAYASTPTLAKTLDAKTLEAWVRLDNLTQSGGGVVSVQTTDGNLFDAIVFGEQK